MAISLRVERSPDADPDVALPRYETPGSAGADVRANLPDRGRVEIAPGGRALVPTGLRIEIPEGYEIQVRPRSGLALRHGVTLPNTPGTIDSDYRGEIGVILLNTSDKIFVVTHGDRIAQLVLAPVVQGVFELSDAALSGTARGDGGFGSTGRG